MIDSHLGGRRSFLTIALTAPLAILGCGGSGDSSHVQVADGTKAEVKARADVYRERTLQKKKKSAPRR